MSIPNSLTRRLLRYYGDKDIRILKKYVARRGRPHGKH